MNFFQDTTLQPSSIKILNLKLNEWISFFPKSQQSILNILMFPDNANKILLESVTNKSNTNLHNFYTAINAVINHSYEFTSQLSHKQLAELKKEWCKIRSDNQKPIVQRRLELLPTENQLQKGGTYLKYDDIIKKRDSLPPGSIEKLLISFYTYIPPVRADYYATEIITLKQKPTQPNYIRRISPTHSIMTLTDFKTKNRYTEITNVLPQELNNELVKSLEKSPRKYIFTNQTGQPFTRNAFTVWSKRILSRVFETEMTLIIIRHLFISSLDFSMKSLELKKISDKMGHDLSTQRNYKWDVSQLNTVETDDE
jgi:hypothetical protein